MPCGNCVACGCSTGGLTPGIVDGCMDILDAMLGGPTPGILGGCTFEPGIILGGITPGMLGGCVEMLGGMLEGTAGRNWGLLDGRKL